MPSRLIGLAGSARVGKDAICSALKFHRVAFADALKARCRPLLDSLGLSLADPLQKEIARPILVAVGAAARAVDPDYWLKAMEIPGDRDVCVSDVRYANEVRFIHARGGIVFRVHRPGHWPVNPEEARSFAEIDDVFDLPAVHNDGTIEEAVAQVTRYLADR
jgi:hypothetical protein